MVAGRLGRMGIVAGMHVAAFYMIATSLGIISTAKPPEVLIGEVINTPRTRVDPDPVPPPTIRNPDHVTVPIPIVPIDNSTDGGVTAQARPDDFVISDDFGTAAVQPPIPTVAPRIDARRPLTQPPYPAADVRIGNEGNADIEVYVLPNGRVGDARILRSTGFERLDRSALEEAKRNWRLIPGTRNGQPEAQWYKVRVTFKITEQR
jgi:periplasmic protein TonB